MIPSAVNASLLLQVHYRDPTWSAKSESTAAILGCSNGIRNASAMKILRSAEELRRSKRGQLPTENSSPGKPGDGERRDKPAHCRGRESPTEKEKRLHSGLESCLWSREGWQRSVDRGLAGRTIELRKQATGCRPFSVGGKATSASRVIRGGHHSQRVSLLGCTTLHSVPGFPSPKRPNVKMMR